jgi:hypothetical protein
MATQPIHHEQKQMSWTTRTWQQRPNLALFFIMVTFIMVGLWLEDTSG